MSETYSKPIQTSKMKLLAKVVNASRAVVLKALTTFARSFSFGRNSESNYIESRKVALEKQYFLKYILDIFFCNKDKITAKYRIGVILKASKLRNDF